MIIVLFFLGSFFTLVEMAAWADEVKDSKATTLEEIVVTAPSVNESPTGVVLENKQLNWHLSNTSDTANLLQDVPGVSTRNAGGISSLPIIHGMADDRLNIQVNGMDLMPACPNHMNAPLSYIDPTSVSKIEVFAGIIPVSVGGDSIGGTIKVDSTAPEFAKPGEGLLTKGQIGGFYRSNGNAYGGSLGASLANENISLSYKASSTQSSDYDAAQSFESAGPSGGNSYLDGKKVGSTAYKSYNQEFELATRYDNQQLDFKVNAQNIPYENFPNQRMDLTHNGNTSFNLHYTGQYNWGTLEARVYNQQTDHAMNFGNDKQFWYISGVSAPGMPMNASGRTTGGLVQGNIDVSERDILRIGGEIQAYRLDDWWPSSPGGTTFVSGMAPNTFWNINNGTRNRFDLFGEWEAQWNPQWLSQLGIRSDIVEMDTGNVSGYNATTGHQNLDSTAFNSLNHKRTDYNWDLTALGRYTPNANQSFEFGYARKTRSPNLYERYTWSSASMMMVMNNFAGDGNGYLGNINLKPEIANTFSATMDWHDTANERWGLKATPYYTYVEDYIDAQRCPIGTNCYSVANTNATTGFVRLQYVNQTAQLYGIDISGRMLLGRTVDYGNFTANGLLGYTRGENLTTHDNLYDVMPLNAKLALVQQLRGWTNTAEVQMVASKTLVSKTRNEVATGSYSLFNLHSSYTWKNIRVDVGIENLFNRSYALPLGGAYVGQGKTMGIISIPWGVAMPGMGRSFDTALNITF